jgi:hypothetical protein
MLPFEISSLKSGHESGSVVIATSAFTTMPPFLNETVPAQTNLSKFGKVAADLSDIP